MPESRTRREADAKARAKRKAKATRQRATADRRRRAKAPATRRWVPPVFITVGLLGVAWLVTYYIAGYLIPPMAALGNWNILIGMGMLALSFIIATLWK